jgi:eukaryotic-like serine/threonine-protein kinase
MSGRVGLATHVLETSWPWARGRQESHGANPGCGRIAVVSSGLDASLVGKVLDGRYEMLEPIGGGGVGVVYRARRAQLDRTVAVKVLHESLVTDDGFVRRFQREAVAMSRLHHAHCLAVIDFGVYESRPYLVLEYVPGQTVAKLLEEGPFPTARALHVAVQLLETLEYFHHHHVIHRDLKSENVMLVESSGMTDFVKVLDFGMAKIITGSGADSQLSKLGLIPGTPSTMAPEQICQLPPDPRIDIYATGILLYEMIVGRRPFSGVDMATVLKMQVSAPPKPPREIVGEATLSAEFEQVILKALEKDRVDRFATAADMAAALRGTPEGRAASRRPPSSSQPRPTARPRRGLLMAVAMGGVITIGGAVAAVLWLGQSSERAQAARVRGSVYSAPVAPPAPPVVHDAGRAAATPRTPTAAVETWPAQRDLAGAHAEPGRDQEDQDALREIEGAVADQAPAAGSGPALLGGAVDELTAERVPILRRAFQDNPQLVEALALATATGRTVELRHAAHEALRALGQESRADLVAMRILDCEQASTCKTMLASFKQLRRMKDPRIQEFIQNLRRRGRNDPHVKCLRRLLGGRG